MLIQSRQKYYSRSFIINWKKNIVGSVFISKGNHIYFPNVVNGKSFITNWKRNVLISDVGVGFPTVTTLAISNRTKTTVIGNGATTAIGVGNSTSRGFVYDITSQDAPGNVAPGASGYDNNVSDSGDFGTGTFAKLISNLISGQIYYYRAFAKNDDGYGYGNEVSFQTLNKIYQKKDTVYNKKNDIYSCSDTPYTKKPDIYSDKSNVYSKKINN